MSYEQADQTIKETFGQLLSPPSPGLEARIVQAMSTTKRVSGHRRPKIIAPIVSAVVILVALGFVPLPARNAPGALAKALAAMENTQIKTLHIISQQWDDYRADNSG